MYSSEPCHSFAERIMADRALFLDADKARQKNKDKE